MKSPRTILTVAMLTIVLIVLTVLTFLLGPDCQAAMIRNDSLSRNDTVIREAPGLYRERFAIKTNLLYDAGGVPSLALEFPISRDGRWSLDISGNYNPISYSRERFWKNWLLQPEARYNFGRGFGRRSGISFFGAAHLLGGQYNLQKTPLLSHIWDDLHSGRFQGWGIGAGVGFGVRFNFSRRVAIEAEIAAGYIYSKYYRYRCGHCGERIGSGSKNYVGLSKAAVNFLIRLGVPAKKVAASAGLQTPVLLHDTLLIVRTDTVYTREQLPGDTIRLTPRLLRDRMALHLEFAVNNDDIDPALSGNLAQLDSLERFIDKYAEDLTLRVTGVRIIGYSSIEGSSDYNEALSRRRAGSMADYIARRHADLAPLISHEGMGEDWESLRFDGKGMLMRIEDPDERQRLLQRLDGGRLYEDLMKSQIPATRRVECVIEYSKVDTLPADPETTEKSVTNN